MADPAQEAEVGTAEEVEEVGAAESEEIVEAEAADDTADDADGDDSETEDAPGKDVVKYSRFKSVNDRRKTAEAKAKALEAEVERLKPKEEPKAPKGLRERLKKDFEPAPSDMSGIEQLQFYGLQTLEKHLPEIMESWFEAKFGTKPEAAAATLAHSAVSTREQIVRQWEEAASARGLDPKEPTLRDAVGTLMDTGRFKTFNDALDVFKGKAATKQPTRPNGKGAEVESVNLSGLVRAKNPILTKEQAADLAAKGKRVEYKSVLDILGSGNGA